MPREQFNAMLFGCQRLGNLPRFSHTWAVFWESRDTAGTPDLESEKLSIISWLPLSLKVNLTGPPEKGKNLTVSETQDWVRKVRSRTRTWGPFRIRKKLYDLALRRIAEMEAGQVQYVVLDKPYRPHAATNCIHALSDLGLTAQLLDTRLRHGFSATQRVLKYFQECGMILGPGS